MNLSPLGWLSPARRAWPLVGLVLVSCTPEPEAGPPGPEGPQGDPGVDGIPGPTGSNGLATLIDAVPIDRGGECAFGGTRYDMGLDNGDGGGVPGDGVLQPGEVDESSTVCDPQGAVSAWEVPGGAAGTATINVSGGDGGVNGGGGGEIWAYLFGTGGHVQAFTTGSVDTSFAPPPSAAFFGPEKLTVTTGQTLTPVMVGVGGDAALGEGVVFSFINGNFADDHLYVRRGGVSYEITGVRIEPNATLVVPVDNGRQSIVVFDNDIDNSGTITSQMSGTNRWPLIMAARHYFGDSSGRIDLKGGDGSLSVAGGEGGWLSIVLTESSTSVSQDAFNSSLGPAYCPTYGEAVGGFYSSNAIETTPGALGIGQTALSGATIRVCARDEIQNGGNLTSLGRGSGSGGQIYLTAAEGGASNTGTLDAHGGPGGGTVGGTGGYVTIIGAWVTNSGALLAYGTNVPTTTNCNVGSCSGGPGGNVSISSYGGTIDLGGTIDVSGGDAFGSSTGTLANGGPAGSVYVVGWDGYDNLLDSNVPAGDVTIGAVMDLSGGNAGQNGGGGGYVYASVSGGEGFSAQGQDVALVGYQSIDATGGNGATSGGYGGEFGLLNGDGYWNFYTCCGSYAPSATTGAAINNVPVDASGGDATTGTGGYGGEYILWARWPWVQETGEVVHRATVDLQGGTGQTGGYGGDAMLVGSGLVESTGTLNASGGAGNAGSGTGGYGGGVFVSSQHSEAGVHGAIQFGGGSGFQGQNGGFASISGAEVDVSASVSAPGGSGSLASGTGGEGGRVDVWSSDTFSVVTGTLSSPGGAGLTTRGGGQISIDGFVTQATGSAP